LVAVIDRLMQKKPEDRYPDLGQVVLALRPWASAIGAAASMEVAARAKPPSNHGASVGKAPAGHQGAAASPDSPRSDRNGAGLPSRESLRDGKPAAGPTPAPESAPQENINYWSDDEVPWSVEERLGPVGIFIGAVVAASMTWLLTLWIFK
jgi:hypothetical protein